MLLFNSCQECNKKLKPILFNGSLIGLVCESCYKKFIELELQKQNASNNKYAQKLPVRPQPPQKPTWRISPEDFTAPMPDKPKF